MHAFVLIEAGYNAMELAEALEVSGQTARNYLRQYQATHGPAPCSRLRGGWAWEDKFSLSRQWENCNRVP